MPRRFKYSRHCLRLKSRTNIYAMSSIHMKRDTHTLRSSLAGNDLKRQTRVMLEFHSLLLSFAHHKYNKLIRARHFTLDSALKLWNINF